MTDESIGAVFRPSKRRRTFRKRDIDEDDHAQNESAEKHFNPQHHLIIEGANDNVGDEHASLSRRPGKARRIGVNFSSASSSRPSDLTTEMTIARLEPTQSATSAAAGRFTAPTGQAVMKEDKHMWVLPLKTSDKTQ